MFKKSFLIKIPCSLKVYINPEKNFLLVKNEYNTGLLKIKSNHLKLFKIKNERNFILILPNFNKNQKKTLKFFHKESVSNIKRLFIDVISKSWKKLKLQGIGYKFSIISNKDENILHLKLGYSHSIYFKLPDYITVKLTNNNVLFLYSNSIEKLTFVSELIKNCKRPDPYKGKGISYVNENINLKLGKKS